MRKLNSFISLSKFFLFIKLYSDLSYLLKSNTKAKVLKKFKSNETFKDSHMFISCTIPIHKFKIKVSNLANLRASEYSFLMIILHNSTSFSFLFSSSPKVLLVLMINQSSMELLHNLKNFL